MYTKAFSLAVNFIIPAVRLVWEDGSSNEKELLRNCYCNSQKHAYQFEYEAVLFSLITTGIIGYLKEVALRIAISEIETFLIDHEMHIYLV